MEREADMQVAPPLFLHDVLHGQFHDSKTSSFARKRGLSCSADEKLPMPTQLVDPTNSWNPADWEFNSVRLIAQPTDAALPQMSPSPTVVGAFAESDNRRRATKGGNIAMFTVREREVDDDEVQLNIGVSSSTVDESRTHVAVTTADVSNETIVRPSKKVRSGSQGSSSNGAAGGGKGGSNGSGNGSGSGSNGSSDGNYPMCQVDDCRADLSGAKDYHRRHKVCVAHSKSTKALVASQMQRFCQQCSRFHLLSEFDEGKRSCRRRLAGHNRRRRKTQPTETAQHLLNPGNQDNLANRNLEIVNLLTVLAHLQGSNTAKPPSIAHVPDKEVQTLGNISSQSTANKSSNLDVSSGGLENTASVCRQQKSAEQSVSEISKKDPPLTLNLLAALSAAIVPSNVANACNSGSSCSSGSEKRSSPSIQPATDVNSPYVGLGKIYSTGFVANHHDAGPSIIQSTKTAQEAQQLLSLQLFTAAEDDTAPRVDSSTKYLSSESSNPLDERSPSSSPPVTHEFFPVRSVDKDIIDGRGIVDDGEDNTAMEASTSRAWCTPLDLFRVSKRPSENGLFQNHYHTSTCDSDHSAPLSNSDSVDRTGRIVFKLFGKEPSTIPENIRDQVLNWLKHSPTEMEGYIRPGCLVLSLYLSMPVILWDHLEENIIQKVHLLVQNTESDFWSKGRFLVRTMHQLVSHNDGMVRLSRSWRTMSTPELKLVYPVAVACGQRTSLVLKGSNLSIPGTKIHCALMGKYLSKEVLCSAYPGTIYDDSTLESFDFPGEQYRALGRCFIEVENGFKGNSFPVIIANPSICRELRTLEVELDDSVNPDVSLDDHVMDSPPPKSREHALQFLNELGWLFQKLGRSAVSLTEDSTIPNFIDFSVERFKYLLVFSVERDWCTIVKTILIVIAKQSSGNDALGRDMLEMLSQIQLPNRAVRRKCRKMVDLLLQFSVVCADGSVLHPFPPNLLGHGGFTPLHLAASSQDMDSIVDALTNDPGQIGLQCWDSLLDNNGNTPQTYAASSNNSRYNELVARKRANQKSHQFSIMVSEDVSVSKSWISGENDCAASNGMPTRTCTQCAMVQARYIKPSLCSRGLLARPYIHSLLGIAAVCVCVCVIMRALWRINSGHSFKWERLHFGAM